MRDHAWPNELLAPYGGITRIRFKGSSDRSDLSAIGSPALFQNRGRGGEVNDGSPTICRAAEGRIAEAVDNDRAPIDRRAVA